MNHVSKVLLGNLMAAAAFCVVPASLQAQPLSNVTVPLKFSLTATVQQPDVVSGANQQVVKHTTKTVKWTTSNLLSLMATSLGTTFPSDSTLILANGAPLVQSGETNETDVSSILNVDTTNGGQVVTGTDNAQTGTSNDMYNTYVTITFSDGNGNAFTLTGLARISTVTGSGKATSKQTVTLTMTGAAGYGTVGGNSAVFTGSLTAKGVTTNSAAAQSALFQLKNENIAVGQMVPRPFKSAALDKFSREAAKEGGAQRRKAGELLAGEWKTQRG